VSRDFEVVGVGVDRQSRTRLIYYITFYRPLMFQQPLSKGKESFFIITRKITKIINNLRAFFVNLYAMQWSHLNSIDVEWSGHHVARLTDVWWNVLLHILKGFEASRY